MTSKDYVYITDVVTGRKDWQVKVVLCEKAEPRTSHSGVDRYMRTVLMDEKGQKVVATVFNEDIELLKKKLILCHTYFVKNARVRPLDDKYNRHGYPHQWILTSKTSITPVVEHPIPRTAMKQNFISLAQLQKPSVPGDFIDVLVIVIDKGPKRPVGPQGKENIVQDFGIINEDNRPMALTLWNSIAKSEGKMIEDAADSMPIIKATGLCVSSFYGLSLSSTPSTSIVVDPEIPEAQKLKTWRANNLRIISDAIAEKKYLAHEDSIVITSDKDIVPIADMVSMKTVDKFLVRVRLANTDSSQKFFYMACNHCSGGIDAEMNHTYLCTKCYKSAVAVPRHKLSVSISDDSGALDVIVFGDSAEKIMGQNAAKAMEAYEKGGNIDVQLINTNISDKIFLVRIRRKERASRSGVQLQYTVISLASEEDVKNNTPSSSVNVPDTSQDKAKSSQKSNISKKLFSEDVNEKDLNDEGTSSSSQAPDK